MFNMRIGDIAFNVYPLLDANEVMIEIHSTMTLLTGSAYKVFIATVEKYKQLEDTSTEEGKTISTYTLIILKSPRYLKAKEIATLFKEAFTRYKRRFH